MTTRYGVSPWLHVPVRSKVPTFARYRGSTYAEVAIVGGGLTGAAVAYAFASAGIRAVVLEAERVGRGATKASPGIVLLEPSCAALESRHGRRVARDVVAALRGAASDFASTLARLRVRPALARRQAVQLAVHENEEEALRREHRSRDAARVETAWLTSGRVQAATGIPARGGLRGVAVGLVDPYRATLGLARAAVARGADFFEQSPVRGVRPGRLGVEVRTDGGTLEARQVVVATCGPPSHARSFNRHVKTGVRYAVATDPLDPRLRRALGGEGTVVRDSAVPPHVLFRTADHRLVAVGADGPPVAARARARTLVQRGGQLMYETSLLYPSISGLPARYVWDMPLRLTADGLPYVGPHRNFPRHLFAFACDQAGLTGALLAARILVRHFRGEAERVDLLFGFGRSGR